MSLSERWFSFSFFFAHVFTLFSFIFIWFRVVGKIDCTTNIDYSIQAKVLKWRASIQGKWTSNHCRFSFDNFSFSFFFGLFHSFSPRNMSHSHAFSVSRINFSERQHWLHPIECPNWRFGSKRNTIYGQYISFAIYLVCYFILCVLLCFSVASMLRV